MGIKFILCGSLINIQQILNSLESEQLHSYQIVGDNLDFYVTTRDESSQRRNKSIHWFHLYAVKDRIPFTTLSTHPQKPIIEFDFSEVLPDLDTQQQLERDFIPLVTRVMVKYLPAFQCFTDVVVHHIPHKYSEETTKKSEHVSNI